MLSANTRRGRLRSKVLESAFNFAMFLYALSIIATAFVAYPVYVVTMTAFLFSGYMVLFSPMSLALRYFGYKNAYLPRAFVIHLFQVCLLLLVALLIVSSAVPILFRRRYLRWYHWEEMITNTCMIILLIESGFWIFSFMSLLKRQVVFALCCYHFIGSENVFKGIYYNPIIKGRVGKYFEQVNAVGLLKVYEIGYHLTAYW